MEKGTGEVTPTREPSLFVEAGDRVAGENLKAATAAGFGLIHGGIHALEQQFSVDGVVGKGADADADGDGDRDLSDRYGDGEGSDELGCDAFRLAGAVEIVEENDELVSSHASDAVGFADGGCDAFGGGAEDVIAGVVAGGIVDVFEVVEVQHEERDALVETLDAVECDLQAIVEQGAGGESGEGVVVSHVAVELTALAEFAGLLIDAAAEDEDPCDGGGGEDQGKEEEETDAADGPPGRGLQDDQVPGGIEEDPEGGGLGDAIALEGSLSVYLHGADAGEAQLAADGNPGQGRAGEAGGKDGAVEEVIRGKDEVAVACGVGAADEAAVDLNESGVVLAAERLLGCDGSGRERSLAGRWTEGGVRENRAESGERREPGDVDQGAEGDGVGLRDIRA